jgi:hypothetical protein
MVALRDLLPLVPDFKLQLIAGESGLDRPVRWFHMVESVTVASVQEANELIFTTGSGLKDKTELIKLVKTIYLKDGAGLIVNIGPYLSEVDKETIDFCNSFSLPLFTCPWEIPMPQIMKRISKRIGESEEQDDLFAQALRTALYDIPFSAEQKKAVQQRKIKKATVCYLAYTDTPKYILHPDAAVSSHLVLFEEDEKTLLFFDGLEKDEILSALTRMLSSLPAQAYFLLGPSFVLSEIGQAYRTGLRFVRRFSHLASSHVLDFADTGIWRLLLSLEEEDLLNQFAESLLAPLSSDPSLTELLLSYLKHNGSLKAVSEELGMHKNTVTNRIHRAEEKLGLDLADPMDRLQVHVALLLQSSGTE